MDNQVVKPDLTSSDLAGLDLTGANLSTADLSNADLRSASLFHSNLGEAILKQANLAGAFLTGSKLIQADLEGVDASGAHLDYIRASRVRMSGAILRGAYIEEADFSNADFQAADLTGADLRTVSFRHADLFEADFTRAQLVGVEFWNADLTDVSFHSARMGWGMFGRVNLAQVKGLETVEHTGPSTIGLDTVRMSNGAPATFLRGAGVSDTFIQYMSSLIGNPIEFYSCFISYSTTDQEFADRLYADLQAKGVRCWFAPHHLAGGKKIHEQIDEAIRLHERLLLILSPASMASEWVKTEIAKARKREVREQRRVLFPVRLVDFEALRDWECPDADAGKDSAREIREYFIPDFSRWKDHDSYQQAFERLLRDLKSEAQRP